MSISNWKDIIDGEVSSFEKRNGSVPKKSITKIEDLLNESSEELPIKKESQKIGPFPSLSHKRSKSCNNSDVSILDFSSESLLDSEGVIEQYNLLPQDLDTIIDSSDEKNTIDTYEYYISRDKTIDASMVLKKMINSVNDRKEKSKIYRNAAEVNKKFGYVSYVIRFNNKAIRFDPLSAQNYIEQSKYLEEIGYSEESEKILLLGLQHNSLHEQLLPKLIKQYERRQKFTSARKIFGQLISESLPKVPQIILDGILFEIKHGDIILAMELFDHVQNQVMVRNSYYIDLSVNLFRRGYFNLALKISKEGIEKYSAMPSNWSHFITLLQDSNDVLTIFDDVSEFLSPVSMSKIIVTSAIQLAILQHTDLARKLIFQSVALANADQKWRYLITASFIETFFGDYRLVLPLLKTVQSIIPRKSLSNAILACAKCYEYQQEHVLAKGLYDQLVEYNSSDWRVYLEYAMFLIRTNMINSASRLVRKALKLHPSTGRLWALKIQLESDEKQIDTLTKAISNSPKSGEIWVEAAKISMNPLLPYFNMKSARFYLNVAFLFTPQYIDIFTEMARLELLEKGLNSSAENVLDLFLEGEGNYGTNLYLFRQIGKEFTVHEFKRMISLIRTDLKKHWVLYNHAIYRSSFVIESIRHEEYFISRARTRIDPLLFTLGLTNFYDIVNYNAKDNSEIAQMRKSVIFGSSLNYL